MMDESALRDVLNVERAATVARIRATQADLDAIVAASANTNNDDEHDPEGPTIAYERAQVVALLAAAQSNLGDFDSALARLATGGYSVCERCHARISSERLAALPATADLFRLRQPRDLSMQSWAAVRFEGYLSGLPTGDYP